MLKDRILSTLRFFDLQDYPLTLLELHRFLLADIDSLKSRVNTDWELIGVNDNHDQAIAIDAVALCLDQGCREEVETKNGFYCLRGRAMIINRRLENYQFGLKRERLIRRFIGVLGHLPFVRGVALGGSQAMGPYRETSDIDLLIITEDRYMWLARTIVTIYFQFTGQRRHGLKIANRFCLNHYLARPKIVQRERNLYKAMEYGRLRPLIYGQSIAQFQSQNAQWIRVFFPNWTTEARPAEPVSTVQKFLESWFTNRFGRWLEGRLQRWQMARIRQGEFIFVTADELSFHPQSKHQSLLTDFFGVKP